MYLIKIVTSIVIITSSSIIGFLYSRKYYNRVESLIYLQNCIQLLETEVLYLATPLPDALENVYRKGNKKVSYIFKQVKDYWLTERETGFFICFEKTLNQSMDKISLTDQDVEILLSLGKVLGVTNRHDQEKYFKTTLEQLKLQQREAELNKERNEKMYRSLGVLAGLTIVIILF